MSAAFYSWNGDRYESSELTRGPWDPGLQHAGPPAALLGREVQRLESDGPRQVGRITFEILRPVPIAPLAVEARVIRPGRRVELIEGVLSAGEHELMRATAWRLRAGDLDVPAALTSTGGPAPDADTATVRPGVTPRGPDHGTGGGFFPTGQEVGYHTAMDYRFVAGEFLAPGPATVWMRPRQPLVAGEQITPLERVLVAADSGNGVSATLDFERFVFINVDLTVHLSRMPAGQWVGLDSATIPEQSGIGITDTALYDERGPIGRAAQTLLVADRPA